MEDQNGPSQGEPTNQPSISSNLFTIAPGLDRTELRQKMVEILALSANGCLQELGYYPGIHGKLEQLEKRAVEWQGENVKLFNDNRRLFAAVNQQKQLIDRLQAEDQRKATTIQHLKVANAALKKSVEESEAALLKKDVTGSAEFFNRKYESLLKEYQTLSGEHSQTVKHLAQMERNHRNPTPKQQQQAQQPLKNGQQVHQVQSSQQQQQQLQQQRQQQSSTQYPPHTVSSHPVVQNPSIFTSLSSHPHQQLPQQNVAYQQMQLPGTSSHRKPSGSMPGPSQQFPVHVQAQGNPYPNMQQYQQPVPGQVQQYHHPSAPPNQTANSYSNGPTQPPQRANTYPIAPAQSVQRPQPHPSQTQMGPIWASSPLQVQPAVNQSQPLQSLWVNTAKAQALGINTSAQNTPSPRMVSSPEMLGPTPNSAPFPPVTPHNSQFVRASATPNIPSRPSSLSQVSSPIVPATTMPLNAHTPLHSPSLKRHSLSISDMPGQIIENMSHKRPRIDGPPQLPQVVSGLPSPVTPSVQQVHTMPSHAPSISPSVLGDPRLQSPPAPATAQHPSVLPVQVTQPVNPPVTPAQSQSPQLSQPVVEQMPQQELAPDEEAMAVDVEQTSRSDSAEAPIEEDTNAGGQADEDNDDGETVEVGPDGLRLVSDCLDEIFGKDRSGTFVCRFCAVRYKNNLMSEPPVTHESPSDEVLAQHLMADHKIVWDSARAVDD